jgi:tight adherence protein C
MKTVWYLWSGYGLLGLGGAVVLYQLSATPAVLAPTLGERGSRRRRAAVQQPLFAALEPSIRKIAGWISQLELGRARAQLERLSRASGYALGLIPDELLAIMLLCGALGLAVGGVVSSWNDASTPLWTLAAGAFGLYLPVSRLQETIKQRHKGIGRTLPSAIDLVALCVGAGTDFPSALKFVINEMNDENDPTREEFVLIVQALELGHTRAHALATFAERVPSESVRDFVNSVIQAEEKGTPLAEVLAIQARMLRMRRSVAAEEAAARAGVMLIGPLMLQLCAIMLILFSPFLINGLGF